MDNQMREGALDQALTLARLSQENNKVMCDIVDLFYYIKFILMCL